MFGVEQGRLFELVGEFPVEILPLLLEDNPEMQLRQLGKNAAADCIGPVVADAPCSFVHLESGFLPDLESTIQHAIDRCYADAGFTGEICNGRPAHDECLSLMTPFVAPTIMSSQRRNYVKLRPSYPDPGSRASPPRWQAADSHWRCLMARLGAGAVSSSRSCGSAPA